MAEASRPAERDTRVAIIGAGAAGLAAARTLIEAGLRPVVLDARARIGGRALTVTYGDVALDHGCGWLHSADTNEWTHLAPTLGLMVDATPSRWDRQFGDLGFSPADQAAFHAASDAFYARIEAAAQRGEEGPAADWLEPGSRWTPLLEAVSSYYNGTELARVSITDLHRYTDRERNWRLREGLGTAVAAYGAGVPVRLDTPVTLIDHAGPVLRLHTPAGVVEADRCIVTVPPTMVEAGRLRFAPELPGKQAAAAGIRLGMANKVFLRVRDPEALPRDVHAFGRADRADTASYHFQPLGRAVVEGYFGGRCASALEDEGPAAFTAYAMEEIAGLFGSAVRAALAPLDTTAWHRDPWAMGAYSHTLPWHAEDRALWAEPVEGRLFFAGEACSRHDFSTVHGAYRTGLAAAAAVLGRPAPPPLTA